MEAMTAAAVAALTVYDMVKGVDRSAAVSDLRLIEKLGGKSGEWHRPDMDGGARRGKGKSAPGSRGPRRGQR
jgi:cyclic pyranopterin phosphate synthase